MQFQQQMGQSDMFSNRSRLVAESPESRHWHRNTVGKFVSRVDAQNMVRVVQIPQQSQIEVMPCPAGKLCSIRLDMRKGVHSIKDIARKLGSIKIRYFQFLLATAKWWIRPRLQKQFIHCRLCGYFRLGFCSAYGGSAGRLSPCTIHHVSSRWDLRHEIRQFEN